MIDKTFRNHKVPCVFNGLTCSFEFVWWVVVSQRLLSLNPTTVMFVLLLGLWLFLGCDNFFIPFSSYKVAILQDIDLFFFCSVLPISAATQQCNASCTGKIIKIYNCQTIWLLEKVQISTKSVSLWKLNCFGNMNRQSSTLTPIIPCLAPVDLS